MFSQPIAVLMALLCATAARAAPAYVRPMNGDCITMGSGTADLSTAGLSLYPEQFMLVGDEAAQDTFFTEVTSALGFTVKYYPTYKVVNNTIADEVYVLYQCGAGAPPRAAFPEGTKFFQVPLTSISAPETVPYAFLVNLGLTDRVHDVSPYVTAPCGQALLQCEERSSPDFMAVSNATLLEETIGGSIDGMLVTGPSDYEKSIAISAAQDPGVLNRAEWMKFVGLFFNREHEASAAFDAIRAEYEATKTAAKSAAAAELKTPVVAWAQHFLYDKSEYFQLSFDPYQVQLTEDAGGAMLAREPIAAVPGVQADPFDPSSRTLIFAWGAEGAFATKDDAKQAFINALKQADVIIDETYAADPTTYAGEAALKEWGLTTEDLAAVPAAKASKIFREDGLVNFDEGMYGLDWFEGALVRPGRVLADLARVLHPEIAQDASFTWFRNLFTEKPVVVGAEACEAKASCTAEPATICPFVKLCGEGQAPAILDSSAAAGGACTYAECGKPLALEDGGEIDALTGATPAPGNAAAMAAPAVVLTVIVVAFVEVMMHFC